jgi:gluconolactonase
MHPYAQTNIQLFNQLRRDGYSQTDIALIRDAYELAMVLYTGRFQPSGRPFIAHGVGAASVLASLRSSAQVVAAGLLHNVYGTGDFGDGRRGISTARRQEIRRVLSSEVEEYVARFRTMYWESPTIQLARNNPDKLASVDRSVLSILLAEHLDHLLDLDALYYDAAIARTYVRNSRIAAEIAERLGLSQLAAELKEAIQQAEFAELPVDLPVDRVRKESFVIAPKSCRKRLSVTVRQILFQRTLRFRSKIQRLVKALLRVQRRYAIRWQAKAKPLSDCLEPNSEAFGSLFPKDAVLERVATGFWFTEGPVWIAEEKSLLFSDIPANKILKLTPEGHVRTFRKPSGNSNGLTRDKEGRLIACEHTNRRLTRTEKDGSISVLAHQFQGKKLNSPNDVVVKSDGVIYFTDPSSGISPNQQEQFIEGVYRLSPDGKELSHVADDFARPNGLAFSPDEKKLYIDDSKRRHIRVFNVEPDSTLSGGSVFADMNMATPGSPDGMKVDLEGNLYCTGAGGVWVFNSDGKHLGTVATPEKPSNCAWGDDDWQSLYITAITSVYKIRVNTPGIRIP